MGVPGDWRYLRMGLPGTTVPRDGRWQRMRVSAFGDAGGLACQGMRVPGYDNGRVPGCQEMGEPRDWRSLGMEMLGTRVTGA